MAPEKQRLGNSRPERLARARASLEGLALGDCFGQTFLGPKLLSSDASTALPEAPWYWTDDTAMALSIYEVLEKHQCVDQDELAQAFASRYIHDRNRGYGAGMHRLLMKLGDGSDWRTESRRQFSGQGSWGNGSAMRVAPLGAYFADDVELLVDQAKLSAEVTHAHDEGVAGAIAVAVGAAWAARMANGASSVGCKELLNRIADTTPNSITRDAIRHAAMLPPSSSIRSAVEALGNGEGLSCQDTVPLVLWCAVQQLDNFEEALRFTASGGGDVDTTCAMVGGIVALSAPAHTIPAEWRKRAEPLPQWVFVDLEE